MNKIELLSLTTSLFFVASIILAAFNFRLKQRVIDVQFSYDNLRKRINEEENKRYNKDIKYCNDLSEIKEIIDKMEIG